MTLLRSAILIFAVASCGCGPRHPPCSRDRPWANKHLVRAFYEQIVSTGHVDRIPDFVSVNYTEVHQGTRHLLGIKGAREHILSVRRTYPDLHLTVERQIAEGEWVASVVTARGTHRGVWLNMTPTDRVIEITAVNVDRVVNGRIVEHGGAADLFTPFMAVGAIKIANPADEMESKQ